MTAHELSDAIDKLILNRLLWNESETPEEAHEHERVIATIKERITEGLKNLKPSAKP